MEGVINKGLQQLRRTHFFMLVVSIAFNLISLLAIGGMEKYWLSVLVLSAVLMGPGFAVHQWICSRLLQPLRWLAERGEWRANQEESTRLSTEIAVIGKFAVREAMLALILWALIVTGFIVVIAGTTGLNTWQIMVLGVVGIFSGFINALLNFNADQKVLVSFRKSLGARLGGKEPFGLGSGRLSIKLTGSFLLVFCVGVGIGSLVWLNRIRGTAAHAWLVENEADFLQATHRLNEVLRTQPTKSLRDVIRETVARNQSQSSLNLIVVDEQGRIADSNAQYEFDPVWLRRIAQSQVSSWRELRTPFLFFSRRLSNSRYFLVQIGPDSLFAQAVGSLGWSVFGFFMLITVCVGLMVWLVQAQLKPISMLSDHYQQASIAGSQTEYPVVFDRELFSLVTSLEEYVGLVRNTVGLAGKDLQDMDSDYATLRERVSKVRETSELRNEVAEQTATSVTQMRSSIQSISEQMDSLREASNDCTSAMFEIDQSIREVSTSVENLHIKVGETAGSTDQITVSIEEVSANIDELANVADETVTSIAIIDGSIKQVENSTAKTHRLSEEVTEYANKGAESVRLTIEGINEIQEITKEAREVIDRLGTQMEAVGKILTVIVDVAEQTNLLALNAAIIAAAAGEHGKGFAVVADEIKDLADRTSTSTKEIAGLIRSVQTESRHAIDAMKRGTGSVKRGVDIANNASDALQQILQSVQQVNEMANDIAISTTEHSEITRNITRSMAKVSGMVREVKREVKEQSTTGDKITKASELMKDDAKFVSRSTNEQVQAVSEVSRNMGRISEMVSYVGRAMVEQSTGVDHVAKVAEEVRDNLDQERIQLAELEEVVDRIFRQSKQFLRHAKQLQSWRKNEP